jgi:hypothetical protein
MNRAENIWCLWKVNTDFVAFVRLIRACKDFSTFSSRKAMTNPFPWHNCHNPRDHMYALPACLTFAPLCLTGIAQNPPRRSRKPPPARLLAILGKALGKQGITITRTSRLRRYAWLSPSAISGRDGNPRHCFVWWHRWASESVLLEDRSDCLGCGYEAAVQHR